MSKKMKEVFKPFVSARLNEDELKLVNTVANRLPVIAAINSQRDAIIAFATFLNAYLNKVDEVKELEQKVEQVNAQGEQTDTPPTPEEKPTPKKPNSLAV